MRVACTNNSGTTYLEGNHCSGTRTERTCYLAPATLRYPITLKGNTLTVNADLTNSTIQSFQPAPPTAANFSLDTSGGPGISTLGGLYVAASTLFSSNATYNFWTVFPFMTLPDTLSTQFLALPSQHITSLSSPLNLTYPEVCSSNWTDPTSHILSALNSMALRVSLSAATFPYRNLTTPPAPQLLAMQQTTNINVFQSDYRYLVAATVIALSFVLLISFTFRGWSELGRRMTLNPIETAKAFDAPLLVGPSSNAQLAELVTRVGDRGVRFGAVETYAQERGPMRQLKLTDPRTVTVPRMGVPYA
jgi:hypothetical protein